MRDYVVRVLPRATVGEGSPSRVVHTRENVRENGREDARECEALIQKTLLLYRGFGAAARG